ncbi:hypothetical protein GRFL_3161 [Christiangramia flava JLT2011]|uniref:Uncharacterized protein n=1 Tax=Christiangramia flava JLT2011 TaxID=1229726 RepID=A0A1L7I9V1_9FLAO|nr:hypothetical protein GRFL_3161 [Christiangramia flava JLT2011]
MLSIRSKEILKMSDSLNFKMEKARKDPGFFCGFNVSVF